MRLAVYLLIFYFLGLLVLTVPALLNMLDLDGLVIVGLAIMGIPQGHKITKKVTKRVDNLTAL